MKEPLHRVWLADVASALRALAATPRYSLAALFSLAFGIAAATAVFAVFSAVVLRPLPFPDDDELVTVGITSTTETITHGLSFTYHAELAEDRAIFASLAGYSRAGVTVASGDEPRHASAALVTPDFFDVLEPGAEQGRTFTTTGAAPDPASVVVISHGFWIAALGGAPAVGTTLVVNGAPKTILGVIADDRALPAHVDLWFPTEPSEDDRTGRFRGALSGVGRLAPGVSVARANEMLRAKGMAQDHRVSTGGVAYIATSSLRESLLGDKRTSAILMLAAVAAFLLLACANVASLMVTRASLRSRELAIRAAMGAGPLALARQSGLESVLLTLCGGAVGLAGAGGLVAAANRVLAGELAYSPARLDPRVLAAFTAIAVVSGIVVGLAPVLHAMRMRPMESLRGEGRSTSNRASRRFRQALVAVQIAMTVVLLISATTLIRAVARLDAVELGVAPDAVAARVVIPEARKASPERKIAFARALVERTTRLPGVTAAAIASDAPFGNDYLRLSVELDPRAPTRDVIARLRLAGPGYFQAVQIALVSGRAFSARDATPGIDTAIVNRAFATAYFGTPDVVGRQLSYRAHRPPTVGPDGKTVEGAQIWYDIVGVVDDAFDTSVTEPPPPMVYVDSEREDAMSLMASDFVLVAYGGSPDALADALPAVVREADRDAVVYDARTIGDLAHETYHQRTTLEELLAAFALASILIAIVGLYGVTSYTVAERTAEIGIRRALGASRAAIMRLVLAETAVVVASGMVVGLGCALAMRSMLASVLDGIDAVDPASYATVCVGIAAVALLSALAPARSAAQVMPSRALAVG